MKEKICTLLKVIILFLISPFIDSKDNDDLNFIYGLIIIFNFISISDKNKKGFFLATKIDCFMNSLGESNPGII